MLGACVFPARGVHSGAPSPPKQVCYSNSSSNNASVTSSSPPQFKYSRASPSVRWPHLNREDDPVDLFSLPSTQIPPEQNGRKSRKERNNYLEREQGSSKSSNFKNTESINVKTSTNEDIHLEQQEGSIPPNLAHKQDVMDENSILESKRLAKRQGQLAIKRANDWQSRVYRLSNAICKLHSDRLVADVLENSKIEQLSPLDYCYVVKRVGQTHWKRALEIYEWLNLWHLYTPNPRMLATILGVLGRANQIVFAEEIFQRAEPKVGDCVQVYNAMMGVYARHGSCEKVQELLNLMRSRGCEPDLVTFNTLINARTKAGYMGNGSAIGLLREVKNAGLRPDIITYNTLISSCAAGGSALEGEEVFKDMEQCGCEPDLWTYNAMISVYGRSGKDEEAEELLDAIKRRGFCPDAVTYNALLYAFARNGKEENVDRVRTQMAFAGFSADEITYNTMIHMYRKKVVANLMNWIGIPAEFEAEEGELARKRCKVPESVARSIDFDKLEGALNCKFNERSLMVEAITHASKPSSGVSCYQRLEFIGDAILDHLITKHLFFSYIDLPPGRLTDLRATTVNNENFAHVAVKHKLHIHVRHGSTALEAHIRDFVKDIQAELDKSEVNSFGLGDFKAPKVLGDIVESIAGAVFLDKGLDKKNVWKIFQPLLQPMVTPETLPMHPVRELQERCQQQAEGLEYKASRAGNLATVEVFVDGVQIGVAQNPQKKMAQKLAARNALVILKEKEAQAKAISGDNADAQNGKKNGAQTFTRQTLNDICLRRQWPMPQYR